MTTKDIKVTRPLSPPAGINPYLGCDPEFFFMKDGKVIGAEKVLPKDGLNTGRGKHIIDGVQGEMNPTPFSCREDGASNIKSMLNALTAHIKVNHPGVTISFAQNVDVTQEEIDSLIPANKVFGCDSSLNAYNQMSCLQDIDASKVLTRAAGGHIHLGIDTKHSSLIPGGWPELVKLLDIVVGNTCVLIDRDPGNRERRKLYGVAGEYRLPKHGLEYRVLSNFWLQGIPLMSLAFGLARVCVAMATDQVNGAMFIKAFKDAVDEDDIRRAINTNNFHLAMKNFKKIEKLLGEVTKGCATSYGISKETMHQFLYFVDTVKEYGMGYWFPDPVTHWGVTSGNAGAFRFFSNNVAQEMKINPKVKKKLKAVKVKKQPAVKVKKQTAIKKKTVTKVASIKRTVAKVARKVASRPAAIITIVTLALTLTA